MIDQDYLAQCICGDHTFIEVGYWEAYDNWPGECYVTITRQPKRWRRVVEAWQALRGNKYSICEDIALTPWAADEVSKILHQYVVDEKLRGKNISGEAAQSV